MTPRKAQSPYYYSSDWLRQLFALPSTTFQSLKAFESKSNKLLVSARFYGVYENAINLFDSDDGHNSGAFCEKFYVVGAKHHYETTLAAGPTT